MPFGVPKGHLCEIEEKKQVWNHHAGHKRPGEVRGLQDVRETLSRRSHRRAGAVGIALTNQED